MLQQIVASKRRGDVDHLILTLHLDQGMWRILQRQDAIVSGDIKAFMD